MKTLTIESKTYGTHHVLLDDEDYDRVVAEGKWHVNKDKTRKVFYVRRHTPPDENGKRKVIYLHRFIADAPRGKVVDHINGDGRDNRKENLRICTHAENVRNCNTPPRGKVGYYGVKRSPPESVKKYSVGISVPNEGTYKTMCGGLFFTVEEAAVEYDKLAKEYHGEFATLNFPDGVPPDVMQKIIAGQKEYEKIRTRHPAEKQSKQKGVTWEKRCNRWRVYLGTKYLGRFKTEEEAIAARLRAERELAEE
jgi:hypothetical protein